MIMRESKNVSITPLLYWSLLGLVLWMTIPLGLLGLLSQFDGTSALLAGMGIITGVVAILPGVRGRLLGHSLPRGNAIVLAVILLLVGILQVPKLFLATDFAPFGALFEMVDKLVLLALIGLAATQLIIGATRTGTQ